MKFGFIKVHVLRGEENTCSFATQANHPLLELVWACAAASANWADSTPVAIKVGGAAAAPLDLVSTPSSACDGDTTAGAIDVAAVSAVRERHAAASYPAEKIASGARGSSSTMSGGASLGIADIELIDGVPNSTPPRRASLAAAAAEAPAAAYVSAPAASDDRAPLLEATVEVRFASTTRFSIFNLLYD